MMINSTSKQIAIIDEHIVLHGLIKDTDGNLDISDDQVRGRILKEIQTRGSNIIVGDPLSALTTEDLNNDKAMLNAARDFATLINTQIAKAPDSPYPPRANRERAAPRARPDMSAVHARTRRPSTDGLGRR